jgi:hypothetical protein
VSPSLMRHRANARVTASLSSVASSTPRNVATLPGSVHCLVEVNLLATAAPCCAARTALFEYLESKMSMTPLDSIHAEIAAINGENLASVQTFCCDY